MITNSTLGKLVRGGALKMATDTLNWVPKRGSHEWAKNAVFIIIKQPAKMGRHRPQIHQVPGWNSGPTRRR